MPQSRGNKRNGVGATCSMITRFLHPRKAIIDKYPKASNTFKTRNLIVLRKKKKFINER